MPPQGHLNNLGRIFESTFIDAWESFENDDRERAERLARRLLQEPRLGNLHKAGCHLLLACGKDLYVEHAESAVALYEHLYDDSEVEPTTEQLESQQDLLEQAQSLLAKARRDSAAIECDYQKQIDTFGRDQTGQETAEATLARDKLDIDAHFDLQEAAREQLEAGNNDSDLVPGQGPDPTQLTEAYLQGIESLGEAIKGDAPSMFSKALSDQVRELKERRRIYQSSLTFGGAAHNTEGEEEGKGKGKETAAVEEELDEAYDRPFAGLPTPPRMA